MIDDDDDYDDWWDLLSFLMQSLAAFHETL